ncbi:MAG: TetR/AcrR family transcriptional regulator [Faecalispora jeddahensis]
MAKAEYKSAIRSRRMIQHALVELLQEKELDKITVTDIVTRADINRGTFYAHYADISGVLDSIMENVCQTIREALEKQPLWAKAPDARIVPCSACESDPILPNAIRTNVSNIVLEKLREFFIEQMMQRESGYAVRNHEQYVFTVGLVPAALSLYKDWFSGNRLFRWTS